MLALLTARRELLFWLFAVAFKLVGAVDILIDCYHGVRLGLADMAGTLGAAYAIPIVYVPLLMITHVVAFYLMARTEGVAGRVACRFVQPQHVGTLRRRYP